jgi:hypothetical protein
VFAESEELVACCIMSKQALISILLLLEFTAGFGRFGASTEVDLRNRKQAGQSASEIRPTWSVRTSNRVAAVTTHSFGKLLLSSSYYRSRFAILRVLHTWMTEQPRNRPKTVYMIQLSDYGASINF